VILPAVIVVNAKTLSSMRSSNPGVPMQRLGCRRTRLHVGRGFWELCSAAHLAHLRLEQKRPNDARQMVALVYSRFVEGFETPHLRAAKLLLDSPP
jgi:predicted ATPase